MQYEDDYALELEKEFINLEKQSRKEEEKMLKELVREFERIENDRILTLSVGEFRW